jgi:hypothetical protein
MRHVLGIWAIGDAVQQKRLRLAKGSLIFMHRELNPRLFGTPEPSAAPLSSPSTSVMGQMEEAPRRVPYPPVDVKSIEMAIAALKGAIIQMERRTETIAFKMEELARTVHARLERFSQAIVRVEDLQSKSQQESSSRFATIVQKVNERKINDGKVQDLVDRHNTIVRNFENRLTSLQRLASEQQLALHNAQAALVEATNEISRLKRT